MQYEIVGCARFKCNSDDPGLNLGIDSEFQAASDDEAMAKINDVLIRDGYKILPDNTLSPTDSWEWLRVTLKEVRSIAQIELKRAQPSTEAR